MERIITPDNLRLFAYLNDSACSKPCKGIVIDFKGLGNQEMYADEQPLGERLGAYGILYSVPYLNPWNWMNPSAVRQVDEILAVITEKCGMHGLPVVYTGGSMGGLACLVYTRYAAITPAACVANCPVCDLPYHYTERPDLPRTLYSAFAERGDISLDEAMRKASPLHLVKSGEMPYVSYSIYHCEEDSLVNKAMHSDRLAAELTARKYSLEYISVPGREHCDLGDAYESFVSSIITAIL